MPTPISQEEQWQSFRFMEKNEGVASKTVLKKIYKRAWKCGFALKSIGTLADNMLWSYNLGRGK